MFGHSSLWIGTREIRRVVYTTRALILSNLGIRAQRSGPDDLLLHLARRNDPLGRTPTLYPIDERRDRVRQVRPDPSSTVKDAWHHEQPKEVVRARSHGLAHLLIVTDSHQRVEHRIRPTDVHDDLATAGTKTAQIGLRRVEQRANGVEFLAVAVGVERPPVDRRARRHHVFEEALHTPCAYRCLHFA